MKPILFRVEEPREPSNPPIWRAYRGLLFVAGGQLLARAGRLFHSPRTRALLTWILLAASIIVQLVMFAVASYLIDLSVSLMELWAELARKHLELTL